MLDVHKSRLLCLLFHLLLFVFSLFLVFHLESHNIGLLFLLYGFYRAIKNPGMSVALTVISLGTRVLLAYTLSAIPSVGVLGIWVSVPIGWILADLVGVWYYHKKARYVLPGFRFLFKQK